MRAHYLRVSRLWNAPYENYVARRERLAEIARDVLFQFSCERDPAAAGPVCVFFQNAKTNERFALDGIADTDSCGFTHVRMRDEN